MAPIVLAKEQAAMKRTAAFLTTFLVSASASACPVSKALVERYGISDGGFLSPPPLATSGPVPSLFRIALPTSILVSDGFAHTLFIDRQANRAWIRRTGGVSGVEEWYGPVDVQADSLEGCEDGSRARKEQMLVVMKDGGEAAGRRRQPETP
ncbi:hypothetical protein [Massilia sp. BKSP1R2A-1]|uniref:hypothetical protein n=1 Tax=Massilia sp. BKSP1R2A-1 TaxID=3422595 RepID=UPI003D34D92B